MIEIFGTSYSDSKSLEDTIQDLNKGIAQLNIGAQKVNSNVKLAKTLSGFSLLTEYDKITLLGALRLYENQHSSHLVLLTFNYRETTMRRNTPMEIKHVNCELVGLTTIYKDIGHVLIRPETIGDKLIELVNPVEIDFKEDKEFSAKYYVVSDDEKEPGKTWIQKSWRIVSGN